MGFKFPILIAGFCLVTGAVNAEDLNAYSIMPEKYASKIFAEFTKDTGIKVNFLRFSSGEAAEKKNPQVDVMLGGPADTYAAGIKEGIFEAYRPKDSDAIPANLRDPGNHWTGIGIIPLCFLTNTKFLEKNGMRTLGIAFVSPFGLEQVITREYLMLKELQGRIILLAVQIQ